MKVERKVLEDKIFDILNDLNKTGQIKELTESNLISEYINKKIQTKILTINLPFKVLNISELYHITRLINSYEKKINVDEYFTDTEINLAMESKNNLKIESNQIVTFENVLQVKDKNNEFWICTVTLKQIYELMKSGVLAYNLNSQRLGVLKKVKNETIVVPYINEKSVKEIKEAMINKRFFTNLISFNIQPEHDYKIEYDSINRKLMIDTSIFAIDIIDGMHRVMGSIEAIEENPDLQGELVLKITSMSIEEARQFILQESKGNIQDKDYLEKYNPENRITMFINNINRMGTEKSNILYEKIDMGVNTHGTWIPFELFKRGLVVSGFMDDIENAESKKNIIRMEQFIVDWFTKFYDIAEDNNIKINEHEILTDPTFIMMLLVTCQKYNSTRKIDIEAMDVFMKKFKSTNTKYTLEYPIKNREEKIMIRKFEKLLEV